MANSTQKINVNNVKLQKNKRWPVSIRLQLADVVQNADC